MSLSGGEVAHCSAFYSKPYKASPRNLKARLNQKGITDFKKLCDECAEILKFKNLSYSSKEPTEKETIESKRVTETLHTRNVRLPNDERYRLNLWSRVMDVHGAQRNHSFDFSINESFKFNALARIFVHKNSEGIFANEQSCGPALIDCCFVSISEMLTYRMQHPTFKE